MSIRDNFVIEGYYYTFENHKFRKFLDIKSNTTNINSPDLMVIMMNPGGSRPNNGEDNSRTLTPAIPDKTQDKIMRVMQNTGYQYARILNLSDLRTPDSNKLYKFLRTNDSNSIAHSIFCTERRDDFNTLFTPNVPVIFAWGVNVVLQPLAEDVIQLINHQSPCGMLKENTLWAYYHPLPPNYQKQEAWIEAISNQLNNQ